MGSLTELEQKALNKFLKLLRSKLGWQIKKIELFGSKARGEAKKDSDVDILIVASDRNLIATREIIYGLVAEILNKYDIYFSVKVFSSTEFEKLNRLKTPFMQNLSREAIVL